MKSLKTTLLIINIYIISNLCAMKADDKALQNKAEDESGKPNMILSVIATLQECLDNSSEDGDDSFLFASYKKTLKNPNLTKK